MKKLHLLTTAAARAAICNSRHTATVVDRSPDVIGMTPGFVLTEV